MPTVHVCSVSCDKNVSDRAKFSDKGKLSRTSPPRIVRTAIGVWLQVAWRSAEDDGPCDDFLS